MRKMLLAIVFVCLAIFTNACAIASEVNKNYYDNDPITVSLDATSPAGEIPPGDRVLAVFTVDSKKAVELYGLDLTVVDNYDAPAYDFVYDVWVEDGDGNVIYDTRNIYEGLQFWGKAYLPAGESTLVVKGRITWGEQFDAEWTPRPEVQVVVNGIYAENEVTPEFGLASNGLIPKYTGINYVRTSLASDSLSGTFYDSAAYEIYKFNIWASEGDFWVSNLVFVVPEFDGAVSGCAVYEGNTLLSDAASYYNWDSDWTYIIFDESNAAREVLIGTSPKTFSLWCQVEVNSPQEVKVAFGGGYFQTGPSGKYNYLPNGPLWGNDLTFTPMEELSVSLNPLTPSTIVPGVNVTLMKIDMHTTNGFARLYSMPFIYRNRPAGSYTNCHITDQEGLTISTGISGYNPGNGEIFEVYFFGPSDGTDPSAGFNFVTVGPTTKTFNLVCTVAAMSTLTTQIDLTDLSLYQNWSDFPYDVKPDTWPLITTTVTQP